MEDEETTDFRIKKIISFEEFGWIVCPEKSRNNHALIEIKRA